MGRLAATLTLVAAGPCFAGDAPSLDEFQSASPAPAPIFERLPGGAWQRLGFTVAQSPSSASPAKEAPDSSSGDAAPAAKKAFAVGGWYAAELAYTYADPAHWSRAVNRLQLSGEGAYSENVKYKIGGRFDVDPVYYGSDFYLPSVKKDQRLNAFWGETFVDLSAGDWDFRIGAQHIVWGEVVGLFIADVVSAHDLREFLLPSFDIIRIPQWAARAEYFAGDSHLELVWIPVQTFDQIGRPGSDFYPVPLPSPTSQDVASTIGDVQRPSRSLNHSSFGIRANTLLGGWDIALLYYRAFASSPTYYRQTPTPDEPAVLQPRYDRIWQTGGTMTKDFGSFVMRAEAVYTHSQNFESTDPDAPQGVVGRPALDYIVSVDVPFENEARLNVQAFQRVYFGGAGDIALKTGKFGLSVLLSGKLTATIEPQILWIQTIDGGGALIRPRIAWKADRNLSLAAGVDIFTGPIDGYFGRYNNRDRVYTELRYDF